MKYTILINQAAVVEAELHKSTNLVDWAILEYINSWQINPEAERLKDFVWINYRHFIAEMPLVGLNSKGGVSNRLNKLEELLLIEKIHDEDGRAFCKTTALYHQVTQFKVKKSGIKPVHNGERGVHNGERGVHNGEQSTDNHNKQQKQIIKNNNNTAPPKPARNVVGVVLKNLSEAQHAEAMKKLESINPEQAQLLIQVFNATTPANSPMMLFNGLLKKAKANLLEKAVFAESATQPNYYESEPRAKATPKREGSQTHHAADLMKAFKNGLESTKSHEATVTLAKREEMRLEVIKTLLPAKKAEWLKEFNEKSFVNCRAISSVILEPDLRAAGLFD